MTVIPIRSARRLRSTSSIPSSMISTSIFKFWRNIGRQCSEREWSIAKVLFEDASTMTIEWTLGRNQNKFHDGKYPSLVGQSQSIVSDALVFSDLISSSIIFQNRLFMPNTSVLDFVSHDTCMTISHSEEMACINDLVSDFSLAKLIFYITNCQTYSRRIPQRPYLYY